MCVRNPASRPRRSRSSPPAPPSAAATTTRSNASGQLSDGISASSIERGPLRRADLLDPARAEIEQLAQRLPVERRALGRRLHLHEASASGHDEVQVDLRARILLVVEVEQQLAGDEPERARPDRL